MTQDILDEIRAVVDAGHIIQALIVDALKRENTKAFNKLRTVDYYLHRRFEDLKEKLVPPVIFIAQP